MKPATKRTVLGLLVTVAVFPFVLAMGVIDWLGRRSAGGDLEIEAALERSRRAEAKRRRDEALLATERP